MTKQKFPQKTSRLLPLAAAVALLLAAAWLLWPPPPPAPEAIAAELARIHYGYEPLLMHPDSEIRLEQSGMMLRWPPQPAEQEYWLAAECFGFSYAVWKQLRDAPGIKSVGLGQTSVAARLGDIHEGNANHVVAVVEYDDGRVENVDLTPLGSGPNPQYEFTEVVRDPTVIRSQFERMQAGIPLNRIFPMKVVEREGMFYYVMAGMLQRTTKVYEAQLRIYEFTPATAAEPLQFHRGLIAGHVIRFEKHAQLLAAIAAGESIERRLIGDMDEDLLQIINENNHLMLAMLRKLDTSTAPEAVATVAVPPAATAPSTAATQITLQFNVTDAVTGEPLPEAKVYVQSPDGVTELKRHELGITATTAEIDVPLLVHLEGYEVWHQVLAMRLMSDRTVKIPIQLEPTPQ